MSKCGCREIERQISLVFHRTTTHRTHHIAKDLIYGIELDARLRFQDLEHLIGIEQRRGFLDVVEGGGVVHGG